jgi:hypothetical protein
MPTDHSDEAIRPLLDPEKDDATNGNNKIGLRRGGQPTGPGYLMVIAAFIGGALASCLLMTLCSGLSLSASPVQLESNNKPQLPPC